MNKCCSCGGSGYQIYSWPNGPEFDRRECPDCKKQVEYRIVCANPKCKNLVPQGVFALGSRCDCCFNKNYKL